MASSEFEVVIVGGGAAGIAAARRLREAGIDTLIVEARERLGGRAWTTDDPRMPLDLGCGWLHSADRNPWREIAEEQGRTIDETPPPWARTSPAVGFPAFDQPGFFEALRSFRGRLEALSEDKPDRAAAEFLEPNGRWNGLLDAVSTFFSGAELDRVSVHDFDRYEDTGVNWRVVEGYGRVIVAHGGGLPVALGCPVRGIDRSGRRLKVETAKGAMAADAVIVTLPSNLLAEGKLLFTPALPEKAEAAAGLPLGLADKLFLSLADAEEFDKDSRLFGRTDRAATAAYHFRPFGRPMIEAYFAGTLAAELEAGGEAAFFDFAAGELAGILGNGFRPPAEAAPVPSLGERPLRPRLLFLRPAGKGRLPRGPRRAGRESPVLRRRGLLANRLFDRARRLFHRHRRRRAGNRREVRSACRLRRSSLPTSWGRGPLPRLRGVS